VRWFKFGESSISKNIRCLENNSAKCVVSLLLE
jgi:hypothetical protein